jgi:uncharacterized protein with GYD domain
MPKYLITGNYTAEGAKGLQRDGGSKRRQAVEAMLKDAGGKLEGFYFTFGDADVIVVADLPDNVSSVALSVAVNASGITQIKTTPLITCEEMDAAVKRPVSYRAPGQ